MLIDTSNVAMGASHHLDTATTKQVKVAGQPRADTAFAKLLDSKLSAPPVQLLTVDATAAQSDKSPFQAVLEMLFGIRPPADGEAQMKALRQLDGPPVLGGLQAFEYTHTSETETCDFSASGNVCLADGSTRQFDVSYHMERSEQTDTMRAVAFRDPLMLDFAQPAGLSNNCVDFDLDCDGKAERMRMPGGNTAVLFDDLNHNGKADDGSELFGPKSGDGFADLAKLDSDGNGWIDSGDAAFAELNLWQLNDDGTSRVQSLAEAGIGALSTQSTATPFTLKEDGEIVGQVRASGLWLGEKSGAGTVRQVDVVTEETPAETQSA